MLLARGTWIDGLVDVLELTNRCSTNDSMLDKAKNALGMGGNTGHNA